MEERHERNVMMGWTADKEDRVRFYLKRGRSRSSDVYFDLRIERGILYVHKYGGESGAPLRIQPVVSNVVEIS